MYKLEALISFRTRTIETYNSYNSYAYNQVIYKLIYKLYMSDILNYLLTHAWFRWSKLKLNRTRASWIGVRGEVGCLIFDILIIYRRTPYTSVTFP